MDIYEDLKKVAALPYRWDKLAGSRIAISGGTGFLGSALIGVFNIRNALYNDDIRVVSLSRSGKKGTTARQTTIKAVPNTSPPMSRIRCG